MAGKKGNEFEFRGGGHACCGRGDSISDRTAGLTYQEKGARSGEQTKRGGGRDRAPGIEDPGTSLKKESLDTLRGALEFEE